MGLTNMNNKLEKTTRVEINCDSNVQIVSIHNQQSIYQNGKSVPMDGLPIGITRCMVSEMVDQEKRLNQLRIEYKENTIDKSTVKMVVYCTILSLGVGYCFSRAYQSEGWENYYQAGFLTMGIIVPACILSTVKIANWLNARKSRVHGS